MESITYRWNDEQGNYDCEFVHVHGTGGTPYSFGKPPNQRRVDVGDFFIGTTQVTQAFWTHIMGAGSNPSVREGPSLPVENVSWDDLTHSDGFLERLNDSALAAGIADALQQPCGFRLPSETEWEYAARGGVHWADGFRFSGGEDIDMVAWYDRKHGDHTQPVALKTPNQLGICDMSGNVWEWCQDAYRDDPSAIPADGSEVVDTAEKRVLRGGCFHNWAAHCTVSKRYELARNFRDGCIGVRLVLSPARPATPDGE